MSEKKLNTRVALIITMIFGAACFRFVDIAPNFAPIAGMSLFGAAFFKRKYLAFLVPFVAMWVSNLILDNVIYAQYYDGFQWFSQPYVFIAFALIVLLGFVFLKKISFSRVLGTSLLASTVFFLVTNFGSWLGGSLYPKTFTGLLEAYVAGIPFIFNPESAHYFFLNGVVGDLFYCGLLFGGYALIKAYKPNLIGTEVAV